MWHSSCKELGMKKWIGYAVIILPIIAVGIKWRVWDSDFGGWVLAMVAVLNCTLWRNYYEQRQKKKN